MLCVFRVCDCDLRVVVFEWLSVCEVRCVICVVLLVQRASLDVCGVCCSYVVLFAC